jgi:CRISPR-associated protein Csy1
VSRPLSGRSAELRAAIERFLLERLDLKLKSLPDDDPKRAALAAQFEFTAWIDDAARRVGQIQAVTHALKGSHPDARGTSLYRPPNELAGHDGLVGSHSLGDQFAGDVVGNAAALDVYKFLRVQHQGRSLLDLMQAADEDLLAALDDDPARAKAWAAAFVAITQARGAVASHTQAKQVYWLVGDDPLDDSAYHLLAPMYASSLAHTVFQTINRDRFGEDAKTARQARRAGTFSEQGYNDYPHLAVQKLGGTKPQNISQLNSERGGNNYLLASLPPLWVSPTVAPPLRTDSVFPRFGRRDTVKTVTRELKRFLESNPAGTEQTRSRRDDMVALLIDELFDLEQELSALPPGWSADTECRLPLFECRWLDPERVELDEGFVAECTDLDWPAELSDRFANWLNERLGGKLLLGDPEDAKWRKALREEFKARQREGFYV